MTALEHFAPGEYILEELIERINELKVFRDSLGLDDADFWRLIAGELEITHELSGKIAAALGAGGDGELWRNLDASWRSK